MIRYPESLEGDLAAFFDGLFTDPQIRSRAISIFDAAVSRHCANLLTEHHRASTSMMDRMMSSDPWFKEDPKRTSRFQDLFTRACSSQRDQAIRAKKIDVRGLLARKIKNKRITVKRSIPKMELTTSALRRL